MARHPGLRATLGAAFVCAVVTLFLDRAGSSHDAAASLVGPEAAHHAELRDVPVLLPPGHAHPGLCRVTPPRWSLPHLTREDLPSLFDRVGLSIGQRRSLLSASSCAEGGCVLTPSRVLVLSLDPGPRAALYAELARFPENTEQWVPFRRRHALGPFSSHPGLPPAIRSILDRLTYTEGPFYLLADFTTLCASLPDDEAKVQALGALMSRGSLRVTVGADGLVGLADLLPPFARARLDTFPRVSDPPYSCFWTAVHFLDERDPGPAVEPEEALLATLDRDYAPVPFEQRRLGDVILLRAPGQGPIHAVSQVSNEVVFTKNGASYLRPWVLARLSDVRASYPAATEIEVRRPRALR
ncbi:MAG: hypothetical protein U0359_38140 [Byssovorax sp.]